jgi:stress response protein YsnF
MSRTVTALYDSREEAERAFQALRAEVSLAHAEVYDRTPASAEALETLDLTPEEREACRSKMAGGEYMLLAQVRRGEEPNHIIAVLERVAQEQSPRADFSGAEGAAGDAAASAAGSPDVTEERLPVIEEELRVGTREVVRGGARVRTRVEELPVQQEVELMQEFTRVERRPAARTISAQELEEGGLLRERVIEIAQVREEAVVNKEAFVREEVVVSKTIERRVEQIHETVRRTEVETQEFAGSEAGGGAFSRAGEAADLPR